MTAEQRLEILGAATVAKIRRRVAAAPDPTLELIAELRSVCAPAMADVLAECAAQPSEPSLDAAA